MKDFYHLKRDNNPLREDAFTLSCLGKLFPASSSDFNRCGDLLASLLDKSLLEHHLEDRILIVGLTESGIIPAFLMYLEANRRDLNPHLVYSTRRPIPGIAFNERHSHGPDHILPLTDCCFKEIWIVEDEITSGNTVLDLINKLNEYLEIERVRIFAFADFRSSQQSQHLISYAEKINICCTVHTPALFRKQKQNPKVEAKHQSLKMEMKQQKLKMEKKQQKLKMEKKQ
ncbi:hypothetical protein MTBBW1_1790029 [Desulfamplus magnetovallimortis]|uniref:Orotate phosphoribosyltransferase-like domain-containing protein n=1 Tax=Desulfamplus magnetovallimortis TaxID=1246637 RepID=A0A1W1HA77_9BACT|nr:hypothetical protein MTBBW1_1790029 [Desulfamplus magnetovallimortis]